MAASIARLNQSASTHYYAKDNYYTEKEVSENSGWFGRGAAAFKLKGPVDPDVFKNLMDGKDPSGKEYLGTKPRLRVVKNNGKDEIEKYRSGVDITFAPPKSVSIAALVDGNKTAEMAHRKAVHKTLQEIESNFSYTRAGKRGEQKNVLCRNLIVAKFEHDTSRSKDPQLHTHCVILASIKSPDGKWRKINNDVFWNNSKYINDQYLKNLKSELNASGIKINSTLNSFEIEGYSKENIDLFSKQSEKIIKIRESGKFKKILGTEISNGRKERESNKYVERKLKLLARSSKDKECTRYELLDKWRDEKSLVAIKEEHFTKNNSFHTKDGSSSLFKTIPDFELSKNMVFSSSLLTKDIITSMLNHQNIKKEIFNFDASSLVDYGVGLIGKTYFGRFGQIAGEFLGEHVATVVLESFNKDNDMRSDVKKKYIEQEKSGEKDFKDYDVDWSKYSEKNKNKELEKEVIGVSSKNEDLNLKNRDSERSLGSETSINEKDASKKIQGAESGKNEIQKSKDVEVDFDNWSRS